MTSGVTFSVQRRISVQKTTLDCCSKCQHPIVAHWSELLLATSSLRCCLKTTVTNLFVIVSCLKRCRCSARPLTFDPQFIQSRLSCASFVTMINHCLVLEMAKKKQFYFSRQRISKPKLCGDYFKKQLNLCFDFSRQSIFLYSQYET